jgi:hypothetical protein
VQRWAEAALDAQLKGMKTSLRLTNDQEKDWAPFESAVKDGEKARVLAPQKEQGNNFSPMDRLNAKAERLAQDEASLKKIVEAAKPLYASLSDAQKHKFIALGRMLVSERARFAMEMKHVRVGEGDQHVAPAGGKSAPSETASTPAPTTPVASGARPTPSTTASAPDAASPEANGATSTPSQAAASTPATTTPRASGATSVPSAVASAPDAASPEANGATSTTSQAAVSTSATTTPAAIGVTESAPEAAAPAASGATAEPSGATSAPTPTTPAAIGATSSPTGVESRPSGTVSGHGATVSATSGTAKAPKGATNHASVRHYANHYTYNSHRYGTAYGRNPFAAVVRGVFGGVADLGSLAAFPVYCFPHYGRCHVFVPY